MSKFAASLRLDRLLSNLGYASRKEVAAACRSGAITLNGAAIARADQAISLDLVRAGALALNGEAVDPPAPLTIMLNKPAGFTCSHKEAGRLVYDLLPLRWRSRKPTFSTVGRLDKDSTGQLLLTDDGDLLHRIIHPRTHSPKHYRVSTRDPLRGDETALFATGEFLLDGDEKPLRSASWRVESDHSGVMILTEGRYHQIRRMFEALGNRVTALHRFQTGGLALGDLDEGQYRILDPEELASITANNGANCE
ncbi:MAG: pseudouridine synthase [Porticoccaceae bacterium]